MNSPDVRHDANIGAGGQERQGVQPRVADEQPGLARKVRDGERDDGDATGNAIHGEDRHYLAEARGEYQLGAEQHTAGSRSGEHQRGDGQPGRDVPWPEHQQRHAARDEDP
jgi:hypothetical protein